MKRKVAVLLVEQDGGWAARAADVLDLYAFGTTREDACLHLERGLAAHLRAMRERGFRLPDFTAQIGVTATDLLTEE